MALRQLALKSVFNFGKLFDYTVSQALSLNKHHYMIWVYYNCSNISYLAEILEILDITKERQIDKPGCGRNYYEEHRNEFNPNFDVMQSKLRQRTTRHFKDKNKMNLDKIESEMNSPERQQAKNLHRYWNNK